MAATTETSLISPVTVPSPPEETHEPIEIPRLPLESGDECNLTPTMSMTTEDDLDPDTLDLSGQEMSKLLRAAPECTLVTKIINIFATFRLDFTSLLVISSSGPFINDVTRI